MVRGWAFRLIGPRGPPELAYSLSDGTSEARRRCSATHGTRTARSPGRSQRAGSASRSGACRREASLCRCSREGDRSPCKFGTSAKTDRSSDAEAAMPFSEERVKFSSWQELEPDLPSSPPRIARELHAIHATHIKAPGWRRSGTRAPVCIPANRGPSLSHPIR